jgi:septum formation protein
MPTDRTIRSPSAPRAAEPAVILASRSKARARLLGAAGVVVRLQAAAVDEDAVKEATRAAGTPPADAAVTLAGLKAMQVAPTAPPEALIIGADQILAVDERWLDKPSSRDQARAQLIELRGRRHELFSAAVVVAGGERLWHHVAPARLWVRPFSDAFLEHYLQTAGDAVLGSVGAYHVEGLGAQLFTRIEGDHFVIQGLPLLPLLDFLRTRGVLAT